MHHDGDGLYLQVTPAGSKSWILRYQFNRRRREMGLGPVALFGIAEARQRALAARRLLADGIDPIEARRPQKRSGRTWGQAAEDYIAAQSPGWRNESQAVQWAQSLKDYGPPAETLLADVDTALVAELLRRIWQDKTETATRVRGRIERIWNAERVAGTVTGDNPARWRGHLEALLPKPSKVAKVRHHRAMPYADVPEFMAWLAQKDGKTRRALQFTILTAARTGEVTGLDWAEIDGTLWTIPAARMKAGREHVIPLTPPALALLDGLPRDKPPFRLSPNTMLYLVQKPPPKGRGLPYTVHGFRSSFRDWAGDTTHHPRDVIEHALAHVIQDKAEAAYRRSTALEKRRKLMQDWAAFVSG